MRYSMCRISQKATAQMTTRVPSSSPCYCRKRQVTSRSSNSRVLASIYLAFLWHAFDQESCRFRNFMSHQRQWLEHARFGGQPRTRALGYGHGARPIPKRRTPKSLRTVIPTGAPGRREIHFTKSMGVCTPCHSGIFACLLRRSKRKSTARSSNHSPGRPFSERILRTSGCGLSP